MYLLALDYSGGDTRNLYPPKREMHEKLLAA